MMNFGGINQGVPQQYGQPMMYPYGAMSQNLPQQAPQRQVDRVTGIEGARMFQLAPNSAVALFDNTRDIFFWKTTDSGGFPTIRAFSFTEIDLNTGQTSTETMSRSDIETMIQTEVQRYAEQFIRNFAGGTAAAGAGTVPAAEHGAAGGSAPGNV